MNNSEALAKLWWAVPASAALVLMLLGMVLGEPPQAKHGSSFDAGSGGFRAAYLLLEELGYPVYRARHSGGDAVRWMLYPNVAAGRDAARLGDWLRQGGVALFADDGYSFAKDMGIELKIDNQAREPDDKVDGFDVQRLAAGHTWVDWPGQHGEVLAKVGGEPLVTVYRLGRGELWLLHRPEVVTNGRLRQQDAAGVLLCRLATLMLQRHPGKLAFDEYCHGMRERPGVIALLTQPPTLWATLHGLALLGLVLWRFVPRFGAIQPAPPPSRRSKEEFLDAVAALLERKGDYASAYATVRQAVAREMAAELGLPADAPEAQLVQEAARRRTLDRERLLRLLGGAALPPRGGAAAFVTTLRELEEARHEFRGGRGDR